MSHNLIRFNPMDELNTLQRRFFDEGFLNQLRGIATPTTDVYTEDDKRMTAEVHLPHFDEKDISVDVDEGALVIQAERHERETDKKKKYVVHESSTSFYRRIALPDQADESHIDARFEDGVLKVVVPYKPASATHKIAIKSATTAP